MVTLSLTCSGATAPQHRADAGQQFLGGERLGDVVVRPGVEPRHLVGLVAPRREHQDGNRLGPTVCAPLSRQHETTLARQHPVEQDDIGQNGIQFTLGRLAVFRPDRLKTVVAQIDSNQLGNR